VKYLFFVGVNDGIVPKNKKSGGIISDTERSFLSEESFELAPTARQNIYIQRYYLYLNITKPSKRLYVSYSMADGSGARKPSVLVRELCKLFPSVETGRASEDITTPEGQEFAIEVMNLLREKMVEFQNETGNQYNLEATPAEGVSARLARLDKARFPDIITNGTTEPYYTNSTQIPVGYTDDIFEVVRLQDELQSLYTGGTVLHLYLGEKINDREVCKNLIKKIFSTSKMPYISITPTFSVCPTHGYIAGEHFECPHCHQSSEVWSRVVGYFRCVKDFNKSKQAEYMDRKKFVIRTEEVMDTEELAQFNREKAGLSANAS